MMRNAKNLVQHELIGLDCEIIESSNPSNIRLKGKLIDERMNIFLLRTKIGDKKIQKKNTKIKFFLGDKEVTIDGNIIITRPEDRIKKKFKKW